MFDLAEEEETFEVENAHRQSFEAASKSKTSNARAKGGARRKSSVSAHRSDNGPEEVVFNGPYEVEFNRNVLEKSRRKLSVLLLGSFRTHWAQGLLYTYPEERKLLLLHRDKGKGEDFKIWKFSIQEEGVLFTRIERYEHRASILQIKGVLEVDKVDKACELVVSFKKRQDLLSFEHDVSTWTRRHPETPMPKRSFVHRISTLKKSFTEFLKDPYADLLEGEDDPEQTHYCAECGKHYGESKLNKLRTESQETSISCPKGHEWELHES